MSLKEFFTEAKFSFVNILAVLILSACFTFLFYVARLSNQNTNVAEIKTAVINVVMLIVGFYFGSSRASAKKDDTINTMQGTINKSTPSAE